MKITRVTPYLVDPGYGKNWLFVKVETSDGLHGWGECYTQADRDQSIVAHVQQLGRYLLGRDASQIRHFTHWAYHDFAAKRGTLDFWAAVSGLEQALWDLAGKRVGLPVVELLGGRCRERVRVYANGWYSGAKSPSEYAAKAKATVARGFTALKFDPFPGPWRTHISREAEQAVVATVGAVREAVGPDVDLLIEVHRRLAPMYAVRVARLLEPFDPFWYEEPVSARDLGALAECRRDIRIPIVTGASSSATSSSGAPPTSSILTSATWAASTSCAPSRPWPRRTTWRSRPTTTTARRSAWRRPSTCRRPSRIS
jgi:galactonate dehydratase